MRRMWEGGRASGSLKDPDDVAQVFVFHLRRDPGGRSFGAEAKLGDLSLRGSSSSSSSCAGAGRRSGRQRGDERREVQAAEGLAPPNKVWARSGRGPEVVTRTDRAACFKDEGSARLDE